jgi:hypothetical protein
MIAQSGGFSDCLVDDRVDRGDAPDELPPHRLSFRQCRPGQRQGTGEPSGDLGRESGEQGGQPAPGTAEIGTSKHDAGADDADADLAGAGHREQEGLPVQTPGRTELVARDDRGGVAGERCGIGRVVAQERRNERARCAPQCQTDEKGGAVLGKHAVSTTIATAPTTVPIMRNQPLRNEAPRFGWQTTAAEVPAQYALSSSSQNAT